MQTYPNKQPYHVEGELGPFTRTPGDNALLRATVTIGFSRVAVRALSVMLDYYVDITEGERGGAPRDPMPASMRAEIKGFAVKRGAKRQKGITPKEIICTLEFHRDLHAVADGLFQISEAAPATMLLHQTDMELPLNSSDDDDEGPAESGSDPQGELPEV